MKLTSRRNFLKASTLVPFVFTDVAFNLYKKKPLLSFSTLGCPTWTFKQILDFAALHQYQGIELRGLQGQLVLTQCPEFATPQKIKETRKMAQDKGVKIINPGASTELHHSEAATRQKNLDQGKRFIDLAASLQCPYVRVFPNKLPETEERNKVMDLIITGLNELASIAKREV